MSEFWLIFIVFFISICIFSDFSVFFLLWNFFSFFDYLCDWESIIIYCALFRQMNALWAFCAIGFTSKKQIWMSWVPLTRRLISLLISLSRYGLAIIKNWIIYRRTEWRTLMTNWMTNGMTNWMTNWVDELSSNVIRIKIQSN